MAIEFLPPLNVEEIRNKNKRAWRVQHLVTAVPIPDVYMNENNQNVAPRQQQDRGTCVGQSTSAAMDYLHIAACGEVPTGNIVRNMVTADGVVHDQLFTQSFSAESIYQAARNASHLSGEDGAYVSVAVKMLREVGICLESQWFTGKTVGKAYEKASYPAGADEVNATRALHRIDGYASITTIDELKQAIATHGVAIGAINVYENYDKGGPKIGGLSNGHFPEPSGRCIGAHALCFVGYSDAKSLLYFRHSWGGWEEIGSISYAYWMKEGSDFWSVLDSNEVKIAEDTYKNVQITSNVAATMTVTYNGTVVSTGVTPFNVNLIIGKQYKVISTSNNGKQVEKIVTVDDSVNTINITFDDQGSKPNWLGVLLGVILNAFRSTKEVK